MEKIYSLLAAALLVSAPAFCANTAVQPQDFNTESVVSKLKSSDTDEMFAVPSAKFISHSYYTQSCARFTLAKSEELETVTVLLTSREMIVEEIPDVHPPVTPPGGHKASADDKMQITHPGQIFTGQGKVTIAAPRTLLPWEQERFSVCMQGPNFALFRDAAAYNYTVKQKQGFFTLTPGTKVPTMADPDGVRLVGVSVKQNKVFATMTDKWAGYYTGVCGLIKRWIPRRLSLSPPTAIPSRSGRTCRPASITSHGDLAARARFQSRIS